MVSRIWTRQASTSCRVSALNHCTCHMPGSSHRLQLMCRKKSGRAALFMAAPCLQALWGCPSWWDGLDHLCTLRIARGPGKRQGLLIGLPSQGLPPSQARSPYKGNSASLSSERMRFQTLLPTPSPQETSSKEKKDFRG